MYPPRVVEALERYEIVEADIGSLQLRRQVNFFLLVQGLQHLL